MERQSIEAVFRALNRSEARYLVVGGLAVVAHGFLRATRDVDLVLQLTAANSGRALEALGSEGYRPMVPVPLDAFADERMRAGWMREKGAQVFQLFSDVHPTVNIDLFLQEPFDFDIAFERALKREVAPDVEVPFVSLDDLLTMKKTAARPQDLIDIERLERLRELSGAGGPRS